MSKTSKRPAIVPPTLEEDRAINAAARTDPDAQPLTARELALMGSTRALRGRPEAKTKKQLVSIRYSPEVLAYFRSTGQGWQSRMDGVLREYVKRQSLSDV